MFDPRKLAEISVEKYDMRAEGLLKTPEQIEQERQEQLMLQMAGGGGNGKGSQPGPKGETPRQGMSGIEAMRGRAVPGM